MIGHRVKTQVAQSLCILLALLQLATPVALAATTIDKGCGAPGALSCAQKEAFTSGINYFDVSPCGVTDGSAVPPQTVTAAAGDKSYADTSRSNRKVGATIYVPSDTNPHPLVIFAPGQSQNSSSTFYKRYLQATADAGFIVAGADFSDNTSSAAIPNEAADIKFLIGQVQQDASVKSLISPSAPVGLIGHSDGAMAALLAGYGSAAGQQDDRIGAVIEQDGALVAGAQYKKGPSLLIMHGSADTIEPASSAFQVDTAITTPYTAFTEFNGADHHSYITGQPSVQDGKSYAQFNGAVDTLTKAFLNRELNGTKNNGTSLSKIITSQYPSQVSLSQTGDENTTPSLSTGATTVAAITGGASSCCGSANGAGANGGTLDSFLKVLAFQESRGQANNVSNGRNAATGKYQYIPTTWVSSSGENYPPATKYTIAADAPEAVQDAVAYIEYTKKLASLGGDFTKMAVSHYVPRALTDSSQMDVVPAGGNTLTPRQYAASVIQKMNSPGEWDKITLTYKAAPDFDKYLASANAATPSATTTTTPTTTDSSCGSGNGAVAGSIIKTAENYAWDTPTGHSAQDSARPEYKTAWDKASNMTDCAAFVGTVMITSKVDPHYPPGSTIAQEAYVKQHPELYQIIEHPTSTAQLQPGDILIHNDGNSGHTLIYIGDSKWQGADASYALLNDNVNGHTPQISPNVTWMFAEPSDFAARYIGPTPSAT
jgi:hypothetical protein